MVHHWCPEAPRATMLGEAVMLAGGVAEQSGCAGRGRHLQPRRPQAPTAAAAAGDAVTDTHASMQRTRLQASLLPEGRSQD